MNSFIDKLEANKMDAAQLMSHSFPLSDVEGAYTFFKNAAKTGALKLLLNNDVTGKVSDVSISETSESLYIVNRRPRDDVSDSGESNEPSSDYLSETADSGKIVLNQ